MSKGMQAELGFDLAAYVWATTSPELREKITAQEAARRASEAAADHAMRCWDQYLAACEAERIAWDRYVALTMPDAA